MVALEDQQPGRERPRRWGEDVALGGDETGQSGNALRQPERRLMVSLRVVGTVGIGVGIGSEPVPSPTYTNLYDLSHAAAPQALRPP